MLFPKLHKPLAPQYPGPDPLLKASILDHIRSAKTGKELHSNLLRALKLDASQKTRRKWKKAAEQRLGDLRAQSIVRPGEVKTGGKIILPGGVR